MGCASLFRSRPTHAASSSPQSRHRHRPTSIAGVGRDRSRVAHETDEDSRARRGVSWPAMPTPTARVMFLVLLAALSGALVDCGDGGSEAQRRGVGSACAVNADCTETGQVCLTFKGGYCGLADCQNNAGCPSGSACVAHTDGRNYCFLICTDKSQCNLHRSADVEANCSSNVTFVDGASNLKACVPPSA